MAIVANRVTVGTTATRLDATTDGQYDETTILFRCLTAALAVGGAGVTSATGFQVVANEWFEWKLRGSDALYAVAASPVECQVIQRGV